MARLYFSELQRRAMARLYFSELQRRAVARLYFSGLQRRAMARLYNVKNDNMAKRTTITFLMTLLFGAAYAQDTSVMRLRQPCGGILA